jgi:N-acetylmuramoyl-L-alanine amidase
MPRKIFITAGHSDGKGPSADRGASGNGYVEGNLAIELRDLIIRELKIFHGVDAITDSNSNALVQTLSWLKGKFGAKDILFDIHWNAGGPDGKGTEVFLPNESSSFENELARTLLKIFTDIGFKYRGIKPESESARKTLGWMKPAAENILLEVCFITNLTDMKLYEANKNLIAKKIATVLKEFSKK